MEFLQEENSVKEANCPHFPSEEKLQSPKVNIIVVRFNDTAIEEKCLASLRNHTDRSQYILTEYDNYPENRPLGHIWNEIIKSDMFSDYFCFLNPDVVLTPNWLTPIISTWDLSGMVAAVGPLTDNCAISGQRNNSAIQDSGPRWVEVNDLAGFLIVISKDAFRHVGLFDEEFGLYGQETDWCIRAREAGMKLILRRDVWVHHDHGATIHKDQDRWTHERDKAKEIMKKKWGHRGY